VLLTALVLGLALSITLRQLTLVALAVWVVIARRAGRLPALQMPLLGPLGAFAAWSVVAALGSARPLDSFAACKHLLNLGALVLLANVLSDATFARRFATWLVLALTVAALIGLVQVAACPGPEVTAHASTLVGKFLRKCSNWVVGGGDRLGRRGILVAMAVVLLVAALLSLPDVSARARTIGSAGDPTTRHRLARLHARTPPDRRAPAERGRPRSGQVSLSERGDARGAAPLHEPPAQHTAADHRRARRRRPRCLAVDLRGLQDARHRPAAAAALRRGR